MTPFFLKVSPYSTSHVSSNTRDCENFKLNWNPVIERNHTRNIFIKFLSVIKEMWNDVSWSYLCEFLTLWKNNHYVSSHVKKSKT